MADFCTGFFRVCPTYCGFRCVCVCVRVIEMETARKMDKETKGDIFVGDTGRQFCKLFRIVVFQGLEVCVLGWGGWGVLLEKTYQLHNLGFIYSNSSKCK